MESKEGQLMLTMEEWNKGEKDDKKLLLTFEEIIQLDDKAEKVETKG